MAGTKKPRLPLHQMIFFSVGNVLNDLCNTIFTSYMLVFQTRVLELPNDIVGLLWLIPAAVDSILALLIGYASDNTQIPYISRFYGRRKSWHLLGCALVGITCPFVLMPCFICGGIGGNWAIVLYYSTIIVLTYAGWSLSHANFLALIPVIARRQSEMVKLGALNSAITLTCGIFVYMVTWLLLGSDSSDTISFSQWKKFMYLVVVVVGTGAVFTAIFHCGTREPSKESQQSSHGKRADKDRHDNDDVVNGQDAIHATAHAHEVSEVIQGSKHSVLVNPSFENDEDDLKIPDTKDVKHKEITGLNVSELEAALWDRLSKKSDEQTDDSASESSSGYGDANTVDTSSEEGSDCEIIELPMPGTFIDMVPHVSEVILHSHRSSAKSTPMPSPRLSRAASRRSRASTVLQNDNLYNHVLRSRLNSTSSRVSPIGTPRLCRSTSHRFIPPFELHNLHTDTNSTHVAHSPSAIAHVSDTMLHKYEQGHDDNCTSTKEHHVLSTIEENVSKNEGTELEIIKRSAPQEDNTEKRNSWKSLFKKAEYYKLGGAYMFTRICQNVTTSYLPLFLTDHLKFGKESIAYFPLVILVSGVFASVAAKKFNKKLGNKWTFCLGSIMVMGASGWFYLLTPENRSVMYVPAILTGCGTSIMFVTTLALAADFVNADRSSGAFMVASMTLLCKIVSGVLFWFLQHYAPKASGSSCPECAMYVHHVFSFTPGVSALLGLISFILFIPATIQCRPIIHTADADTQTIQFTDEEPPRHTHHLEAIIENEKEVPLARVLVDAETQTEPVEYRDTCSSTSEVNAITIDVRNDDNSETNDTRF